MCSVYFVFLIGVGIPIELSCRVEAVSLAAVPIFNYTQTENQFHCFLTRCQVLRTVEYH
jgi:hypothetical protein